MVSTYRSENYSLAFNEPQIDISIKPPQDLSGLFLKVRLTAKLKCPRVGLVSAFAEDVFAPGLELLQGFQHVVLVQISL